MGWQFVAVWVEEPDPTWQWSWRRMTDDAGELVAARGGFASMEDCIENARGHGFSEDDCGALG